MFSQLGDKLQDIFKDLRGHGSISETNITDAMRQVRLALLEADVDYQVAKRFIAQVREKALGEEVLRSVTPGQQIVKIFHDELTALLGGAAEPLNLEKPARILMVGLNGAGKTTSSAKLARLLKKQGRAPLADRLRFASAGCDRSSSLHSANRSKCRFTAPPPNEKDVLRATAGQFGMGRSRTRQRPDLRHRRPPGNRRGVDRGNQTTQRNFSSLRKCSSWPTPPPVSKQSAWPPTSIEALGITGIVLTKLDGDARGGAALSMREVTQRPIKFAGVGEKLDQFEVFVPDRLAGRILGMGDIVGLVEKAAEAIDEEEAARMEQKLRTASFDFNDFLAQFKMMRKLGPLENILGMLPGMGNLKDMNVDEKMLKRTEAIVLSMTDAERRRPDILNARRRQRIARGSGSSVTQVNDLLQRFNQMRKLMKNAGKMKRMMAQMSRMKS